MSVFGASLFREGNALARVSRVRHDFRVELDFGSAELVLFHPLSLDAKSRIPWSLEVNSFAHIPLKWNAPSQTEQLMLEEPFGTHTLDWDIVLVCANSNPKNSVVDGKLEEAISTAAVVSLFMRSL